MGGGCGGKILVFVPLAIIQVVTLLIGVMVLVEDGYGKMQVNELVRKKDSRNKGAKCKV